MTTVAFPWEEWLLRRATMLHSTYIAHLGDFSQSTYALVEVIPQAATASTQVPYSSLFTTHATIQHCIIKYRSIIK